MESLTQADIDEIRAHINAIRTPSTLDIVRINSLAASRLLHHHAEALLEAAERWLKLKEDNKKTAGCDMDTIYDRAAYGEKCRKFFRELNAMLQTASVQIDRHTDDESKRLLNTYLGRYSALEDVINTAKSAGLLEEQPK